MSGRAYNNTRREQKRQATREQIIRVMVDTMSGGEEEVAVSEIAEQAQVSVRTVYAHFPNRASRLAAISEWIDAQVGTDTVLPGTFEDLPDYAERLVDYAFNNEPIIRAQMVPGLSKDVRAQRKQPHVKKITRILVWQGWSKTAAANLAAFLVGTIRAEAIYDLRDSYGLGPDQIKQLFRRSTQLAITDGVRGIQG